MTINMFEGARRIAKVIAVFIVIGFAIAIVFDSPRTESLSYVISGPGDTPIIGKVCGPNSATKSKYWTTKRGQVVEVSLCFEARNFTKIPIVRNQEPLLDLLDDLTWKEGGYAGRPEGPALDYFKPGTEVRSLIPYRRDKSANLVWAKDRSAAEVQTYISGAAESFQIPEADEEAINNLWWSKRLEHAGEYFLGMLASAAALYVVSWIVGWVVRGFLGIPRGSDTRA